MSWCHDATWVLGRSHFSLSQSAFPSLSTEHTRAAVWATPVIYSAFGMQRQGSWFKFKVASLGYSKSCTLKCLTILTIVSQHRQASLYHKLNLSGCFGLTSQHTVLSLGVISHISASNSVFLSTHEEGPTLSWCLSENNYQHMSAENE